MQKVHAYSLLVCILLAVIVQARAHADEPRDVCILGGGIGGFSTAVFLKDRGYNPLIIEKTGAVGGHCNTEFFIPPSPGLPNWIDLGVVAFPNTTYFQSIGLGTWNINSVDFFARFGVNIEPVPFPPTTPLYYYDFNTGTIPNIPATNITEFENALDAFTVLLSQYPWMLTLTSRPDPIPADLLQPFSSFITEHNLQSLIPLFRELMAGATTNLTAISAFDAIRMACNMVGIESVLNTDISTFTAVGGCIQLYTGNNGTTGMVAYIGEENVLLNANVQFAIRPDAEVDLPIALIGTQTINKRKVPFAHICKKLVVSFAPLLEDIQFLVPDEQEASLFSQLSNYNYIVSSAIVRGPITVNSAISVTTYDPAQPNGFPKGPCVESMFRYFSYGPAAVAMTSPEPISIADMKAIAQQQLNNAPDSLLTSVNFTGPGYDHVYLPYFPSSSLATSPDAYTQLDNLQGHRNTFYSSALTSLSSHMTIANYAYGLVAANFPPKPSH